MNLLLDTNVILYFLGGDERLGKLLNNKSIFISFITELELLAYPKLQENERTNIDLFLDACIIIDINEKIKKSTIQVRKNHQLKLPDAIIAATSISEKIPLLSADQNFHKVEKLKFIAYEI